MLSRQWAIFVDMGEREREGGKEGGRERGREGEQFALEVRDDSAGCGVERCHAGTSASAVQRAWGGYDVLPLDGISVPLQAPS